MSSQQMTGMVVLLLGVAALIVFMGAAWTLSSITRTRPVEGISFITEVIFLLLLVGLVLCNFGICTLMEGG
jgi:hypothetical protein